MHSLRICTHRTNHGGEQSELWPWCPTPDINTNDEVDTSTYISTCMQHNTERQKTIVSEPILGNDLRSRPPGHGQTHFLTIRFRKIRRNLSPHSVWSVFFVLPGPAQKDIFDINFKIETLLSPPRGPIGLGGPSEIWPVGGGWGKNLTEI